MADEKPITQEQKEAIKKEAREAAKKELGDLATSTRDLIKASDAHKKFVKDWEKKNPGGDFIKAVNDGSDTDKEYSRLLKVRREAFDRQAAADYEVSKKIDPVVKKHGLETLPKRDPLKQDMKKLGDEDLPEGLKIKHELRDESFKMAKALVEAEKAPKDTGTPVLPPKPVEQGKGQGQGQGR